MKDRNPPRADLYSDPNEGPVSGQNRKAANLEPSFRAAPIPAVRVIGGCLSTLSCYRLADNQAITTTLSWVIARC